MIIVRFLSGINCTLEIIDCSSILMNRNAGPEQFEIVRSGRFSEKQIFGSVVAVIAIVPAKLGLS